METTTVNMAEHYATLIRTVLHDGARRAPRGQPVYEIPDVTIRLEEPAFAVPIGTGRALNARIGALEYLQLLAGVSHVGLLDAASDGRFSQFANDNRLLGAYGPRIEHQLHRLVRQLDRDDPDTRQAVLVVLQAEDLQRPQGDVPCTTHLTFRRKDGLLHLSAHLRSSDLWLGVPYDAWQFTRLQLTLADVLGLQAGVYTHQTDNLHLYERDVERAKRVEPASTNYSTVQQPPHIVPSGVGEQQRLNVAKAVAQNLLTGDALVNSPDRRYHADLLDGVRVDPEWEFCVSCRYYLPPEQLNGPICERCNDAD